jgi:DNA-binding MarR family transcriptional regulator
MQNFHDEKDIGSGNPALESAAQVVVETGVRLTRFVRRAVRSNPPSELSLSAVRALSYVVGTPEVCVSDLADYLLVGAPTASKLVDELASRELVTRSPDEKDRRRVMLRPTPDAEEVLATVARPVRREVANLLSELDDAQRRRVVDGMTVLGDLLLPGGEEGATHA